jgi:thiosulfate reductase cytochrome b subunit
MFAYLFMLIGVIYFIGLFAGGGYRSLIPRPSDLPGVFAMLRYYLGLPFAKLARKPWPHPHFASKYNPLQRLAYFSMPILGILAVASGWAIHKPQELGWLQGLFGGYDTARVWHFWIMWAFAAFVIPHIILVIADGWDTFRSMVTGWSERTWETDHGK